MTDRKTNRADLRRTPLGSEDLARSESGARRLSAALASVLNGLPETARTTGGLARHLGIDRSVSQRVLAASRVRGDYLSMYSRMPGIAGLRHFLEAASSKGVSEQELDNLSRAILLCGELVTELAGSLASLVKRIQVSGDHSDQSTTEAERLGLRQQFFESSRLLAGREVETFVSIMALRTMPDDPTKMQCARVTGYIGVSGSRKGMPLVRSTLFRGGKGPDTKTHHAPLSLTSNEPVVGFQTGAVLERFSSDPFPQITSRKIGEHLVQLIDFENPQEDNYDVVLGARVDSVEKNPPEASGAFFRFAQGIQTPAKHLIMDLWQDRSLARSSIPTSGVYQTTASSPPEIQDRWYERFLDGPRLQHLGQGLSNASSELYPRQAELTQYLFQCLGWSSNEFVGARLETPFPIWRGDYQIVLDFSDREVE